jgi:hypothetical protein
MAFYLNYKEFIKGIGHWKIIDRTLSFINSVNEVVFMLHRTLIIEAMADLEEKARIIYI